jgi:hypothetical protein
MTGGTENSHYSLRRAGMHPFRLVATSRRRRLAASRKPRALAGAGRRAHRQPAVLYATVLLGNARGFGWSLGSASAGRWSSAWRRGGPGVPPASPTRGAGGGTAGTDPREVYKRQHDVVTVIVMASTREVAIQDRLYTIISGLVGRYKIDGIE